MLYDWDYDPARMTNFTSQDVYDNITCQPGRGKMVPPPSEYKDMINTTVSRMNVEGVAAFALNGVPVFTGSSAEKTDPYYPQNWAGSSTGKAETVDACIGHPQGAGLYHYHMLPPCLVNKDGLNTT